MTKSKPKFGWAASARRSGNVDERTARTLRQTDLELGGICKQAGGSGNDRRRSSDRPLQRLSSAPRDYGEVVGIPGGRGEPILRSRREYAKC